MNRRTFLMNTGKTAAITATAASLATRLGAADAAAPGTRINHSVCKWCYNDIPLEDLSVREEFERPLALLVARADAIEHELTSRDHF